MDGTLSICQTTFIPLLSLKVSLPTESQHSSTQNLLVSACWSQVCSQDLQSVLTWLDDIRKQTPEQALHGNNSMECKDVILLPLTFSAAVKDNCVTADPASDTVFLLVYKLPLVSVW